MYELHPFIKSFANQGAFSILPPQLISKKRKSKKRDKNGVSDWEKQNLDSLETIARLQYNDNRRLLENYKLVNGEFIPQDYIDCEDCDELIDPLKELVKDGQIPKFIKHYDIISTPVNILVDEMNNLPNTITVVGKGDPIQSEKENQQTKLLQEYIFNEIENRANIELQQQGIDVNKKFEDPQEQQQYDQQIAQKKDVMQPKEIKEFMQYGYRHIAELWGEYELEDQKERYNLKKLQREEFRDALVSSRRFRHLRIYNNTLTPESWNPLQTFYQKSMNTEFVQYGDYAGRIYVGSIPYTIDRFGSSMTEDQIKSLEAHYQKSTEPFRPQKDWLGNKVDYLSTMGTPYNTALASSNPSLNMVAREFGEIPLNGSFLNEIYDSSGYSRGTKSMSNSCVITESYWKSQKKIGRLAWINPETGYEEIILVDEDFLIPDYIVEVKSIFATDRPDLNTITWTWINEVWQGIKINAHNVVGANSGIYIDIKPCDYQAKSSAFLNEVKLPVCGQIFNSKNTTEKSFVDLQKPLQFVHNVLMNKGVKMLEVSILPFLALNVNMMPNQKDWGSGDASQSKLEKILAAAQDFGVLPTDNSPSNVASGNTTKFAEVVDIDLTARIMQMFDAANSIRQLSLQAVGFTAERVGDVRGVDTATGINTSVAKSHASTARWITEFMECEKDIIKMQLDIAQWLQSKSDNINASYVKSDFSQAWLKFNNNNFNLYDLHIYISDSQKELKILADYKRLALELNTVDLPMSSRMEMLDMVSPERIKKIIKMAEQKANNMVQQANELKQQEINANTQLEKEKAIEQRRQFDAGLVNKLKEAYIKAFGHSQKAGEDEDNSGVPDMLEYNKFVAKADNDFNKLGLDKNKFAFEKEKEKARQLEAQAELLLKKEDQVIKKQDIAQSAKNVKVMDKGKYKG
jgi:hypothetical protein